MSKQLLLFPEWENYKYRGKIYKRYMGNGNISYIRKKELEIKLKRFIDEYNKKTI